MQSNYKRIGDYIRQVKVKNTHDKLNLLQGININKYFMPSVANIVGTNLARYKVVKPSQFACNRMHVGRDYRIPIALSLSQEPFIVSPAYTVFEIVDTTELIPEYLMMWFSRTEFDRECWFHTDADVRGGLPWNLFCDIELPIPSIEKQKEIVAEYNTVVNRIKLNEQLNQKLEETAQALYKHWFVNFEFPDENGKPYKSSGGKMAYNAELDKEIPEEWDIDKIGNIIKYNYASYNKKDCFSSIEYLDTSSITNNKMDELQTLTNGVDIIPSRAKRKVVHNDIVYSTVRPNLKHFGIIKNPAKNMLVSTGFMVIQSVKESLSSELIYMWLTNDEIIEYLHSKAEMSVSTYPSVKPDDIVDINVVIPKDKELLYKVEKLLSPIFNSQWERNNENRYLEIFKGLLLSKMSKI
jgi:type I restriction enzyme, S subunit